MFILSAMLNIIKWHMGNNVMNKSMVQQPYLFFKWAG